MKPSDSKALLKRMMERMQALDVNDAEVSRRSGRRDIVKNIKAAAKAGRRYSPGVDTMAALADALETTPEWLMGRVENPEISHSLAERFHQATAPLLPAANPAQTFEYLELLRVVVDAPLNEPKSVDALERRLSAVRDLIVGFQKLKPRSSS